MRTMWPLRWPNLSSLLIMSTFALSAAKSSVGLSCKPTTNPASFMVSGGRIRNPRQCRGSRRRYFINYDHDSHTRSVRPTLACSLDDLRGVQREKGGLVGDVSYDDGHVCKNILLSGFEASIPKKERSEKVEQAVALATLLTDKSHWGVIRVEGEDRLRFLHSQGTNAFQGVAKGTVVSTCFTTNIGRVVDLSECVVLQDEVWLLSAPHRWQRLLQTMDKFIFPMDKTTVSSLSDEMAVFSLAGPQAPDVLGLAKCPSCPPPEGFIEWDFQGEKVIAIGHARPITRQGGAAQDGDGVPSKGGFNKGGDTKEYTLIVPSSVSGGLWSVLSDLPTVVTAGEEEWQTLRIKQGFPFPGKELTNDYNPLEAGLWHSVHFDKGCYIGQESISRVNAYKAVKNGLYGVSFEKPGVPEGAELLAEETGKRAGVVTSMMDPDAGSRSLGLAYVKTQAGGVGLKVVTKEGVHGTVISVPYPTRSDAESAMPPVKKKEEATGDDAAISLGLEEEKAKEAARKAAKLEAMQKKLDALKARRKMA